MRWCAAAALAAALLAVGAVSQERPAESTAHVTSLTIDDANATAPVPAVQDADEPDEISDFVEGTGAEHYDLLVLRQTSRSLFDTVLATLHLSPHVALGYMRAAGGQMMDEVIFSKRKTMTKSPWSWTWYIIAPGALFVRYLTYFFDTNPLLVTALVVCYIGSDLSFWIDLYAAFRPATRRPAIRAFMIRVLLSIFAGAAVLAFYTLLPLVVTPGVADSVLDVVFHAYAAVGWATSLFVLYYRFRNVFQRVRVTDPSDSNLKRQVTAAMRQAVHASDLPLWRRPLEACGILAPHPSQYNGLFSRVPWTEMYSLNAPATSDGEDAIDGNGSYGIVRFGVARDGQAVAIKTFKRYNRPGLRSALEQLARASLRITGHGQPELAFERLVEGMGERLRLVDEAAVDHARHEALALTAVRALQHEGLLQLLSAHKATTDDGREEVVIVTQRAGPSLEEIADCTPLETRLAIVQRLCAALARLHAGGIVHRDLKPSNVCVSLDDVSAPIIIDFGTALLPGREDRFMGVGTTHFFSPEICKVTTFVDQQLKRLWAAGATYAADVWALGLTAAWFLLGDDPVHIKMAATPGTHIADENGRSRLDKQVAMKILAAWRNEDTVDGLLAAAAASSIPAEAQGPILQLLAAMLNPDPARRISAQQASVHRCFGMIAPSLAPPVVRAPTPTREKAPIELTASRPLPTPLQIFRQSVFDDADGKGPPSMRVRPSYSPKLMRSLREALTRHMPPQGCLDASKLVAVLCELGMAESEAAARAAADDLLEAFDANNDRAVDRQELLCGLSTLLHGNTDTTTVIGMCCDGYGRADDGNLSLADLSCMLQDHGVHLLDAQLRSLFASMAGAAGASSVSKAAVIAGLNRAGLTTIFFPSTKRIATGRRLSRRFDDTFATELPSPRVEGGAAATASAPVAAAAASSGAGSMPLPHDSLASGVPLPVVSLCLPADLVSGETGANVLAGGGGGSIMRRRAAARRGSMRPGEGSSSGVGGS